MNLIKVDAEKLAAITLNSYREAIDTHVDQTAKSRGYNGAASISTYVNSSVPEWKSEAEIFVAWRDSVWVYTFGALEDIKNGDAPTPETVEDFIATLPAINWNDGEE